MQTVIKNSFLRGVINRTPGSCYPCLSKYFNEVTPQVGVVRWAFQPKSKLKRKAAEVPGYRIGVTKAWDSWHTGNGILYTRKNARSVTAFNSTDIRAEQDNVATPVTAMMATVSVCISTDIRPTTELM